MILGIDFDGTIVTHKYPEIGLPISGAIETIKTVIENGHDVFLWTMRGGRLYDGRNLLDEAVQYCDENGINLAGINRSPVQFSTSPKQYAYRYIDDTSIGCPLIQNSEKERPFVDWVKVGELLVNDGFLTTEQFNNIWNNH